MGGFYCVGIFAAAKMAHLRPRYDRAEDGAPDCGGKFGCEGSPYEFRYGPSAPI
jgi:hypothetical protein